MASQPPTPLDAAWTDIVSRLRGVLSIAFDSRWKREPHHAHASWLVVHLTRVAPRSCHMADALGAVATLCAAAERLRHDDTEHLAFWTRVLTSEMMVRPRAPADKAIEWFAGHTRVREIRLKLVWTERPLAKALLVPVKVFLEAKWGDYDGLSIGDGTLELRSMRVAIRVEKAPLTDKAMDLLGEVLARPKDPHNQPTRLFEPSLASLEFHNTKLSAVSLRALATRVYPRARPIDALRLEAVIPTQSHSNYAPAFKSALAAALDASHCSGSQRGVQLSLAFNRLAHSHLLALLDALRSATRDLTALSLHKALVHGLHNKNDLVQVLEAITFEASSPSGRVVNECELDLTDAQLTANETRAFFKALEDRVRRCLPRARQALAQGERVTCRVHVRLVVNEGPLQYLDSGIDYTVVGITNRNELYVAFRSLHSQEQTLDGRVLVSVANVVELAVDDAPLFQSRFTRLILDRDENDRTSDDSSVHRTLQLVKAFGRRLTFLSMRNHWHSPALHTIIGPCTRLQCLDLEGSSVMLRNIDWVAVVGPRPDLATLNLARTRATSERIEALVNALVQAPHVRLQHLSLAHNPLPPPSCLHLRRLLDRVPSLARLQINGAVSPADDAARAALVRDYHGAMAIYPMQAPAKRAFLSGVRCVVTTGVERGVLRHILALADDVVVRQIVAKGMRA